MCEERPFGATVKIPEKPKEPKPKTLYPIGLKIAGEELYIATEHPHRIEIIRMDLERMIMREYPMYVPHKWEKKHGS